MADTEFAALLLAAGSSERMGAANKLLLEIDGEPIIRRAARPLIEAGLTTYVVTGHDSARVAAALKGLDVELIHNLDYKKGQMESVRVGLQAIAKRHSAILVALGDQPFLEVADIEFLLDRYRHGDEDKFLVPYFQGQRGHPVVIPASLAAAILETPHREGPLTDAFPDHVDRCEVANDHFTRDIDTPSDIRQSPEMAR